MADDATKYCAKCGEGKPLGEFARNSAVADGRQSWCRECQRAYRLANRDKLLEQMRQHYAANREAYSAKMAEWRKLHPEAVQENNRRWYAENRERSNSRRRQAAQAQRDRVFAHYGEQCACCGTSENLTIDHINGDGGQHRTELYGTQAGGERFYRWLIRNNFPEAYQALCWTCNRSKSNGERCRLEHR